MSLLSELHRDNPPMIKTHASPQATDPVLRMEVMKARHQLNRDLGVMLDQMCTDLGFDPESTWRRPRYDDHQRRLLLMQSRYRIMAGMAVNDPRAAVVTVVTG